MTYIEPDERGGLKSKIGDQPLSAEAVINLTQAVDLFASAMKAKLIAKASQGFNGWDDPKNDETIMAMLWNHHERLNEGDPQEIDIANLAMMLWWHRNEPRLRQIYENDLRASAGR